MITIIISIIVTITTVIIVLVSTYFIVTQCKKKKESGREIIYDVPYGYELPPLPPPRVVLRRNSEIYETISNGSDDELHNQPQVVLDDNSSQHESRSLENVVVEDSEASTTVLNNSPPCNGHDANNTVNNGIMSQNQPAIASPLDAAVNCTRPSDRLRTTDETDETEPPVNLQAGVITTELTDVEDQVNEPRMNIMVNVSYQPSSTCFNIERNPAYGTDIAVAPEIETSENIAYECCENSIT